MYKLLSDDLLDKELPLKSARAFHGCLAIWKKHLDPFMKQVPIDSTRIQGFICQNRTLLPIFTLFFIQNPYLPNLSEIGSYAPLVFSLLPKKQV